MRDPLIEEWIKVNNSIEDCWELCQNYKENCTAVTFSIPLKKCQFFKNLSARREFDSQFVSFTTYNRMITLSNIK